MRIHSIILLLCVIFILNCKKDVQEVNDIPSYFGTITQQNFVQLDKKKVSLGRHLFYDPILSRDSSISCASCHMQRLSFSDGQQMSLGVNKRIGRRNAPALQNLLWSSSYFWDGGVNHIDLIALNPISNHDEMDEDILHIAEKLNRQTTYIKQFKDAFNTDTITPRLVLECIGYFQASLISQSSKYDEVMRGNSKFTTEEEKGKKLFEANCSSCHSGHLQTNYQFKNNGMYQWNKGDHGRFEISTFETDRGRFKVPSLRNVIFTAPYMHDGSLTTLEDVLQHYSNPKPYSPNLDSVVQKGIKISIEEQSYIVSFLKTLSDEHFIQRIEYSKPSE